MTKFKGIISGVNQKEGRYGIIIADIWYNGNGECPVNKGDQVEGEFELNGEFRNIKKIEVTDAAGTAEAFKPANKYSEKEKFDPTNMYVSYAKDLVVAAIKVGDGKTDIAELMPVAVKIVMKARAEVIKELQK